MTNFFIEKILNLKKVVYVCRKYIKKLSVTFTDCVSVETVSE